MTLFQKRDAFPIGQGTYNPFERPSVPLASVALDQVLGGGPQPLQPENALALPVVYRCISILSTIVAQSVLEQVDRNGVATPWSNWQNLVSYTPYEITEIIVAHLAGWGNFFALKVGTDRNLLDLQPVFPGAVHIEVVNGQKQYHVRVPADPANPNAQAVIKVYTDDQMLHIPFMSINGVSGMSPLGLAAHTVGTALAADALAGRFYSSGQTLAGIVKIATPLENQNQADAIKERWMRTNAGVNGGGGVAVMDSETDFQALTIAPDNLQFLESRQWQVQELARLFGLPLTMISIEATGYGDAIEAQQEGLVTYTIRSYTDRIEQRLAREFTPRGTNLRFNLDGVLRGATQERYSAYETAITSGWMTRAEVREFEGMAALPPKYELDVPLAPSQAVAGGPDPVTAAMAAVAGASQTAPEGADDGPDDQDDTDNQDDEQNSSWAILETRDDGLTAEQYLATLSPSELMDLKANGVDDPELDRLIDQMHSEFQKVDENGWTGNSA